MPWLPITDDCSSGHEAMARIIAGRAWRRNLPAWEPPPSPPPPEPEPEPEPEKEEPKARTPRGQLRHILLTAAEYFGLDAELIISERRTYDLTLARQIIMYLCTTTTTRSFPEIAKSLHRDHSTVLHGNRKIEALVSSNDMTVIRYLNDIKAILAGSPVETISRAAAQRSHLPWPKEEKRVIREMFEKGKSIEEIANSLGRSFYAVERKLSLMRLRREEV